MDDQDESALEVSAARTTKVGEGVYGVSSNIIKHLSIRSMETFRPLCHKWQEFLGLDSRKPKAAKAANLSVSLSLCAKAGCLTGAIDGGDITVAEEGRTKKKAKVKVDESTPSKPIPNESLFPFAASSISLISESSPLTNISGRNWMSSPTLLQESCLSPLATKRKRQ